MAVTSSSFRILLAIIGFATILRADTIQTGYAIVSDYGSSTLDRFLYTFDLTTNTITGFTPDGYGGSTTSAVLLGSAAYPVKEGVLGTANDLIVITGAHGSTSTTLTRYTLDGNLIGTIPVNFQGYYNNSNVSIGNVEITPDGKYLYVALQSPGDIAKVDLSTGNIVASYTMDGAHDVAIAANGDIYAANYAGSSPSIVLLDSNLNLVQTLVSSSNSGVSNFVPTGISVAPDGSIYVENNQKGGPDTVLHYALSGSPGSVTATLNSPTSYLRGTTTDDLQFTFGNNLGPDGNLYIADLGSGGAPGSFPTTAGFTNGVYEFDPTTNTVSLAIAGATGSTVGLGGLSAPKYLEFDTNFITANDAGYVSAPETSSVVLLAFGTAVLAFLARKRYLRSAH